MDIAHRSLVRARRPNMYPIRSLVPIVLLNQLVGGCTSAALQLASTRITVCKMSGLCPPPGAGADTNLKVFKPAWRNTIGLSTIVLSTMFVLLVAMNQLVASCGAAAVRYGYHGTVAASDNSMRKPFSPHSGKCQAFTATWAMDREFHGPSYGPSL